MPVIKRVIKDIDINEIENFVENIKNDSNKNHNQKRFIVKKSNKVIELKVISIGKVDVK